MQAAGARYRLCSYAYKLATTVNGPSLLRWKYTKGPYGAVHFALCNLLCLLQHHCMQCSFCLQTASDGEGLGIPSIILHALELLTSAVQTKRFKHLVEGSIIRIFRLCLGDKLLSQSDLTIQLHIQLMSSWSSCLENLTRLTPLKFLFRSYPCRSWLSIVNQM